MKTTPEAAPEPAVAPAAGGVRPPVIGEQARGRRWRRVWFALAGLFIAVLVLLFLFNPAKHSFYPFCAFYRFTGLQCPGCGGLRSVHHLLHGDLLTAFRFNPLVVLAAPAAAYFLARRWWCGPRKEELSHRAYAFRAWLVFALLLVFWVVRNLPIEALKLPSG